MSNIRVPQNYKAVYFADMPAEDSRQKSLTVAFGVKSKRIFDAIKDLSSEEIRQLIGSESYMTIVQSADLEEIPINRYCVREIKKSLYRLKENEDQLRLINIGGYDYIFDPISVTFKGGAKDPFVRWYPYLQGYSPQFVQQIIQRYAPNAKVILDPFGGTGTTAFTAAQMNINSFLCEVNPVLQFIYLTKIRVRRTKQDDRLELFEGLISSIQDINNIQRVRPDQRLLEAFPRCFNTSQFFDEITFDIVLRIRSWIDRIALSNPLIADLLTIAVLAALVPSSQMIRVGDMRYKTAIEAMRNTESMISRVTKSACQIADDIRQDVNGIVVEPVLITENARSLGMIPRLDIDTVITSPPYINGTNYFRNTKIELWFMRCLNNASDLSEYRRKALTAGINDITEGKRNYHSKNADVQKIVTILDKNAYDARIPRMIASYFGEMEEIFRAISKHLTNRAVVAIDIGDSSYGGVHVPVEKLLSSCIANLGYEEKDLIELRKRRSKDGTVLKQSLLIYEFNNCKRKFYLTRKETNWRDSWELYTKILPHQTGNFAKRNWGHPLHSLCSYSGKMKPSIAHNLVDIFVPKGGKLLDPFAGVGTIPFEGALQGKMAYGFEISPSAYVVANGKMYSHDAKECRFIIDKLKAFFDDNQPTREELDQTRLFGYNGKLAEYYHPATMKEIILARRFFLQKTDKTPEDYFVLSSLLHILHGNRPYALSRRSHPITPYKPTGPIEYRSVITQLEEKILRGMKDGLPSDFNTGKIIFQDATNWWPQEIDKLDAIITSPPFFDSTRFYLANWIRLWFCGWGPLDFEGRPLGFMEERQKKDFEVYTPIFRQARERLKPNGVVVMHLGKSIKCDMAEQLIKLANRWFTNADTFEESVLHCETHGIRDKGTVSAHQYLVIY